MVGRVDTAKGKVKEAVAKVTGSQQLEGEGAADQASGKVQGTDGDAKEKVKSAVQDSAKKI